MKKVVKLNESLIKAIIKESVKSYINEAIANEWLRKMAKKYGGISHVNPKYRLDRTDIPLDIIKDMRDIPYSLEKFYDEVCTLKNGYVVIAIKPEYESNEETRQKILDALSSYTEVINDRNDGIEPISWYEDERDDDGRHYKSKQTLSPQGVRTLRHKGRRGKSPKGIGGGGDKDYQRYVNDYGERMAQEKYNAYILDDFIAIPVENMWGQEAYDIEQDLKRYGYVLKNKPYGNMSYDYIKSQIESYGYTYNPDMDYLVFSRYNHYDDESSKLAKPDVPKIGHSGFEVNESVIKKIVSETVKQILKKK